MTPQVSRAHCATHDGHVGTCPACQRAAIHAGQTQLQLARNAAAVRVVQRRERVAAAQRVTACLDAWRTGSPSAQAIAERLGSPTAQDHERAQWQD